MPFAISAGCRLIFTVNWLIGGQKCWTNVVKRHVVVVVVNMAHLK